MGVMGGNGHQWVMIAAKRKTVKIISYYIALAVKNESKFQGGGGGEVFDQDQK